MTDNTTTQTQGGTPLSGLPEMAGGFSGDELLLASKDRQSLRATAEALKAYINSGMATDAAMTEAVKAVSDRLDRLIDGSASDVIDTFNEIEAFLQGITDTQTLTGLLADLKNAITTEYTKALMGKVDKVDGKGLSTNDYTDEDRQKLEKLPSNEQFGITGLWRKDTLMFVPNPGYRSSCRIPVNRNFPIKVTGSGTTGAAALIFFDAKENALSAYNYENTSGAPSSFEIQPDDIPASAVYFACSAGVAKPAFYSNGETIESREGAVSNAIATVANSKLDKSVYQSGLVQFGYDGYYTTDGRYLNSAGYKNSGLIPVNHAQDIVFVGNVGGIVASIAFFDGAKQFVGYRQVPGSLMEQTIPISEIPESAAYFAVNTNAASVNLSYYRNGTTFETRENAVADAIQASKLALFVDQWNSAWGNNGKYDPVNAPDAQHPFMGNKIWMSYDEAVATLQKIMHLPYLASLNDTLLRTNLIINRASAPANLNNLGGNMPNMEALMLAASDTDIMYASSMNYFIATAPKLQKIVGVIDVTNVTNGSVVFYGSLPLLEEIKLRNLKISFDLSHLPKLSLASLQYLVTNAANTSEITITVHPDVYAKLSDETNAEWHKVMTDAAAKNISFATTE